MIRKRSSRYGAKPNRSYSLLPTPWSSSRSGGLRTSTIGSRTRCTSESGCIPLPPCIICVICVICISCISCICQGRLAWLPPGIAIFIPLGYTNMRTPACKPLFARRNKRAKVTVVYNKRSISRLREEQTKMADLIQREFREQLVQAARMLFQAGVVSHRGRGTMRARPPGTEHLLLTSGFPIVILEPEQVAVGPLGGEVIESALEPVTHEIVAMHSSLSRARPNISAVIHTHSPPEY